MSLYSNHNLNHVDVNAQTPNTLTTTYKTRFESGGVLNECELEWRRRKRMERKNETNKENTQVPAQDSKRKTAKRGCQWERSWTQERNS